MEKVSLSTIAEKTGFSESTVSRVINGKAREFRISEKTEKKILKAVKKLGYKPNPVAVNLRVKKSFTVGLIIPSLDNPFFVNITSILDKQLTERGYNIVLTESYDDPEVEKKMIENLNSRNVDGIVLIPSKAKGGNPSLLEAISDHGVPVLCIDRYFKDSKIPYVTTDNVNGAYQAIELLIKNGHQNIACIQGIQDSTPAIDRKNGYLKALQDNGLEPYEVSGNDFSIECGYREMNRILARENKPTAIFAMSSTIALGVIKAIEEAGLRIPEDFSLVGFDDNVFLDYLSTPLTTICQPVEEISKIVSQALINHIDGDITLSEFKSRELKPSLVQRKSVTGI
ncbi:LacI family DNA-binding transcriptional regulator [Halalkalibaculum sp. DA3122]|uniref:LacI family DNA-binding transcriptional regulator n=1 Tax=Halalkalibaculum sp. DA3122 TaxID=3373607 RepID=UPI0037543F43